jgi:hypothetical protein
MVKRHVLSLSLSTRLLPITRPLSIFTSCHIAYMTVLRCVQFFSLLGFSTSPEDSLVPALINLAIPVILAYFVYKAIIRAGYGLSWQGLRRLLFQGAHGQAGNARQQQGRGQQQGRPQRATMDMVSSTLQKLPTEDYAGEAELEKMSVHDLKGRLANLKIPTDGVLEKRELIALLAEAGGSSSTSCSICFEDYCSGDAVRVLPCKHRFHIECIDKWFYSSTDYTRPPACPLCNAELLQSDAQAAGAARQ